jgi:hypothetical protein
MTNNGEFAVCSSGKYLTDVMSGVERTLDATNTSGIVLTVITYPCPEHEHGFHVLSFMAKNPGNDAPMSFEAQMLANRLRELASEIEKRFVK